MTEPERVYFEVELIAKDRDALVAMVKRLPATTARKRMLEALECARKMPGDPPKRGGIDWDEAERRAAERGGTLVDLFWDEARQREDAA